MIRSLETYVLYWNETQGIVPADEIASTVTSIEKHLAFKSYWM